VLPHVIFTMLLNLSLHHLHQSQQNFVFTFLIDL
jgi:hypothetical protein